MIQIKTLFSGWVAVDKETAKKWALGRMAGITAMKQEKIPAYMNSKLRGITIEELLK